MKKTITVFILLIIMIFSGYFFCKKSYAIDNETEGDTILDSINDTAKEAFNNMFTKYEGTQKGSTVKVLIQEIEKNNADNDTRIVKIEVNASDIEVSSIYNIKVNYDDNGYVNEVIVQKQSENENEANSNNVIENNNEEINKNSINNSQNINNVIKDETTSNKSTLPKTGVSQFTLVVFLIVISMVIGLALKVKKYKDIK